VVKFGQKIIPKEKEQYSRLVCLQTRKKRRDDSVVFHKL